MREFLTESVLFGAVLSMVTYGIGCWIKKKIPHPMVNPLLISIALCILCIILLKSDYETYYSGAQYIGYLLTPSTICLAVPLYEKFELLKKNYVALLCGITAGAVGSMAVIFALSMLFGLEHTEYVTLLPKSITTAIGMGVSEELGGHVTITVAVIIITGVIGNIFAEAICKIFRIEEPIAQGLAIGTAAHAVGTAKAMEMGEIEGAMSSLSIAVAGILTVIGASVFAQFL